jgi:hypothetical protein
MLPLSLLLSSIPLSVFFDFPAPLHKAIFSITLSTLYFLIIGVRDRKKLIERGKEKVIEIYSSFYKDKIIQV